jgi:hypothetical protein
MTRDASYELRITKTAKRRDGHVQYLVERIQDGEVVNSVLLDRNHIRLRLLAERGISVSTNVRDFRIMCEQIGTPVTDID